MRSRTTRPSKSRLDRGPTSTRRGSRAPCFTSEEDEHAEGADEGWLGAVSELSSGLPPCLMVHNPTTAVISTRV